MISRKIEEINLDHRAVCGGCFEFFIGKGYVISKDKEKVRTLCATCVDLLAEARRKSAEKEMEMNV